MDPFGGIRGKRVGKGIGGDQWPNGLILSAAKNDQP